MLLTSNGNMCAMFLILLQKNVVLLHNIRFAFLRLVNFLL